MPAGRKRPIAIVSCPAPDGSSRTGRPRDPTAVVSPATTPGAQVKAGASCVMATVATTPRSVRSRRCAPGCRRARPPAARPAARAGRSRPARGPGRRWPRRAKLHPSYGRDEVGLGGRGARSSAPSRRRRRRRRDATPSRRPGVPAIPSTPTSSRVAPSIARDDAHRQPLRLQHRPLLDMGLDEGGDIVPAERARLVRIAPEGLQSVAHHDAGRILLVERVFGIVAGERPRSRQRGAVPHPLFVAEGRRSLPRVEPLAAFARSSTTASAGRARRNCRQRPASRTVSMCEPSSSAVYLRLLMLLFFGRCCDSVPKLLHIIISFKLIFNRTPYFYTFSNNLIKKYRNQMYDYPVGRS